MSKKQLRKLIAELDKLKDGVEITNAIYEENVVKVNNTILVGESYMKWPTLYIHCTYTSIGYDYLVMICGHFSSSRIFNIKEPELFWKDFSQMDNDEITIELHKMKQLSNERMFDIEEGHRLYKVLKKAIKISAK